MEPPPAPRWRRRLRRFGRWIERCFAILGVLLVTYLLGFDLSRVVSDSMAPTLRGSESAGDWVLTERISYRLRNPRRWEVVTFRSAEKWNGGWQVMKRVAGLPGESIGIREGRVRVGGAEAPVPSSLGGLHYYAYGQVGDGREVDCDSGYFILGDDSKDSQDSRFDGPLPAGQIIGRAWLVVWPLRRFGFVNP